MPYFESRNVCAKLTACAAAFVSRRREMTGISATRTVGAKVLEQLAGLNIGSTSLIDTSYFYFGLALGCIDTDICK